MGQVDKLAMAVDLHEFRGTSNDKSKNAKKMLATQEM